jgi:hypothetical protein
MKNILNVDSKNACAVGCSFKCILKVGVEESIVNAPLVTLQSKNANNAKSEVRFKEMIRDAFTIDSSTPTLRINLNEHPIHSFVSQNLVQIIKNLN